MSAGNFLYCSLGIVVFCKIGVIEMCKSFLFIPKKTMFIYIKMKKSHFSIIITIAKFIIYTISLISGGLVMMTVLAI